MSCKLCFKIDDIAFQLASPTGIMHNAQQIIEKHFPFGFAVSVLLYAYIQSMH